MQGNAASIAKLLGPVDLSPEDLWGELRAIAPNCSALLVGSLNEELATATSDIDILIVSPSLERLDMGGTAEAAILSAVEGSRNDATFPGRYSVVLNRVTRNGAKLQCEITSAGTIIELQDQVRARLDNVSDRIAGKDHSSHRRGLLPQLAEQILLHRVYSGTTLTNAAEVIRLRQRLSVADLGSLLAIVRSFQTRSAISDLQGLQLASTVESDSMRMMVAIRALSSLAGALLAATGNAAPIEKTRFAHLYRTREVLGEQLVASLLHAVAHPLSNSESEYKTLLALLERGLLRLRELCPIVAAEARAGQNEGVAYGITRRLGKE